MGWRTYTKWSIYKYIGVGCDSVHTVNLAINYSNTGSSSQTACDSFAWDGILYTSSGAYTNTYTNSVGCDSILLNLTINNSNTGSSSVTVDNSMMELLIQKWILFKYLY